MTTPPEPLIAPLIRHDEGGITSLTLNRPARYNTLDMETIAALNDALAQISADPAVRVVVLGSTGRAFSTGHNLKEMRGRREPDFLRTLLAACARMMQRITTLPQPVIAKVQGIATAAGCQLVATCDLAIAARSAQFATSGINYGLFCATPAVALSRTIARKHALEMLFTGDFIDAETAARIGLINHAVEDAELETAVYALASKIALKSTYATRLGKTSFYQQLDQPLDAAYRGASAALVENLLAPDGLEGLEAFAEKREPRFI